MNVTCFLDPDTKVYLICGQIGRRKVFFEYCERKKVFSTSKERKSLPGEAMEPPGSLFEKFKSAAIFVNKQLSSGKGKNLNKNINKKHERKITKRNKAKLF